MPDNDSDPLEPKVLDWLKNQDYSLEMRVAQIFKHVGVEASQFENYLDPESNDLREIDVVASTKHQVGEIDVSVRLFVECKYLRNPWVIFISPRRFSPFSYFSRTLGANYNVHEWKTQDSVQGRLLARILLSLGRENTSKFRFFSMPQTIGYGVTEALRSEPRAIDNAYTATMQVSKCIEAHDIEMEMNFQKTIEEYEERVYESETGESKFSPWCSIAFPVIVVKGKLFECYLDSNSEIALSETMESLVLVSNKSRSEISSAKPRTSAVRIITESHTKSFAHEALQAVNALLSQESAIRELWEYEYSKISKREHVPF